MKGTIYVLHFSPRYKHAGHYVGWTRNPIARFARHLAGRGSPLVRAALAAGCQIEVAALWEGTRDDERRLKNRGSACRYCPTCRGGEAHG